MRRVVVISDHALLAELLDGALRREPDLDVVSVASSVEKAMVDAADVTVIEMADVARMAATSDEARRRWPGVAVVLLSERSWGMADLLGAVRGSTAGLTVMSAAAVASARSRLRSVEGRSSSGIYPQLTDREREVLQGLASGAGPAAIARSLGISLNTCRGYQRTLMAKMGARSQREVVAFVARHGLPPEWS